MHRKNATRIITRRHDFSDIKASKLGIVHTLKMNRVRLYYAKLQTDNSGHLIEDVLQEQWLSELSQDKQVAIRRLINDRDRLSSLFGLRLLLRCAMDEEICGFRLADVHYPEDSKPYWHSNSNQQFDFNISHSDDLILVAVSATMKVGVDIEKVRRLNNLNFKMVMTADELKQIKEMPDLFFNLWSKKEAVVKAANTTGIARMRDVELVGEQAVLDGVCWHIRSLDETMGLVDRFSVHLATSCPVEQLIVKNIPVDDLIYEE